jgi:hypothetical protein
MSANHHLMAKATTDSILANFKAETWTCVSGMGSRLYRVGCDSAFPSPDATFYDDDEKLMVSFEFKPPTETKRGILTGLGQAIAYLGSSNLSYLISPQYLEDFNIGSYLSDLYKSEVVGKLPVGLILYPNNDPSCVILEHNVNVVDRNKKFSAQAQSRFWAKHQDLPIPLFHLILHCYYLKKIGHINVDAFAYCFDNYLVPIQAIKDLSPKTVLDVSGNPIKTLSGKKDILFLEKKINAIRLLPNSSQAAEIQRLEDNCSTAYTGDNYFNSMKKNFVTFLKHLGCIDSEGAITEMGFKLYNLGLANGPTSKLFFDYFTKTVLLEGHHLDLIFDVDQLSNEFKGEKSITEIRSEMNIRYLKKGMIKLNPNRQAGAQSSVDFLKYEYILWNSLGLVVSTSGVPNRSFNWRMITEICSLPDL